MYKERCFLLTIVLGIFLLLPVLSTAHAATPIDGWVKTNPFIANVGAVLNAVTDNGSGIYVAVGNQGVILRSTDCLNWSLQVPIERNGRDLMGVAYGIAGTFTGFMAVGSSGTISTSPDGIAWESSRPAPITGNLKAIAYSSALRLFVAVGSGGGVFTYDGSAWTRVAVNPSTSRLLTTATLNAVIYTSGQARFTAVGSNSVVLVSFDGIYWQRDVIPSGGTLQGIAFGSYNGPRWVAVNSAGTVFVSTDGFSAWTAYKPAVTGITARNLRSIFFDSNTNQFIVAGDKGSILLSGNGGADWVAAAVPTKPGQSNPAPITTVLNAVGLSSNGTVYYAVGQSGTILMTNDPRQWLYASTSNPTGLLNGAAFGAGRFVTAGQCGNIFSSADGVNWLESRLTKMEDNTLPFIQSITFGDGFFVAVGNADSLDTQTAVPAIYTSPNGLKWSQQHSFREDFSQGLVNQNLYGVAAGTVGGEPVYVAVGTSGTIITSPDGVSWVDNSVIGPDLNGVTFGSGQFVAVGDNGTILVSADGITWTEGAAGTTVPYFQSVAFGGGTFVAVAGNGNVYYASDPGGTWTKSATTIAPSFGVTYGTGSGFTGFVAVGAGGSVWASSAPFGVTWDKVSTGKDISGTLIGVAVGNGIFVASGVGSTIITKAP